MKKRERKGFVRGSRLFSAVLSAAAALTVVLAMSVPASANSISYLDIRVVLSENGDARVTETFETDMDRDTEMYLVKSNMRDMQIEDLTVADTYNGIEYTNEGEWDTDRTRQEKAGKCGLVTKGGGYEICWGIGEYGRHTYEVSYTMTNMVQAFTDYNGFNIRFFNDDFSFPPEEVRVTIEKEGEEFTSEDTKVWAFGFSGEVWVEDGRIVATTNESLTESDYVNVMARFDRDMFTPASTRGESFSELENEAKKGSDYGEDDFEGGRFVLNRRFMLVIFVIMFVFVFSVGGIVFIFAVIKAQKAKAKPKGLDRRILHGAPWCRSIPFGGDLDAAYYVLEQMRDTDEGALIGAYLLRWAAAGAVSFAYTEAKGFLGMGKTMQPSIVFALGARPNMSINESNLYNILLEACGGDAILQEKELYKWSQGNYRRIYEWYESVKISSEYQFISDGKVVVSEKKGFLGIRSKEKHYTQSGLQAAYEAYGFKRYLQDFTIINERRPVEVELWGDYLVFATLFNIADEVASQFRNIYPAQFDMFSRGYGGGNMDMFMVMSITRSMSMASRNGASAGRSAANRSSGGGGFSSGGGGGGFSGGGSGGGSR